MSSRTIWHDMAAAGLGPSGSCRCLCLSLILALAVGQAARAAALDYASKLAQLQEDNVVVVGTTVADGEGRSVSELAVSELVYVAQKTLEMTTLPSGGSRVAEFKFGAAFTRIGVCENGYSHVVYHGKANYFEGYVQTRGLSMAPIMDKMDDNVTIATAAEVLDYPSRRDGDLIGEVNRYDTVKRTGSFQGIWTRIAYADSDGIAKDGYILTSALEGYGSDSSGVNTEIEAGVLHEGTGEGVFAEAIEGVTMAGITSTNGVLIGTPESVGEEVTLRSLGIFRITHYCPCSICCGPYADGITSTGVTAVTNHTIAVSPSQIPYGSRVAINGQMYYAEDCGGAIKDNCIDVYVATHQEALERGVFYTEVYLIL